MKSNVIGYETTVLRAILLTIAYIMIGLIIPTALHTMLWDFFDSSMSEWANIVTLTVINIMFFIGLAKKAQYKVSFFDNITVLGILLAVSCSVLFFLLLDKFLDPIFDSMFPMSAEQYQETLSVLRRSPVTAFIRVCLFAPITEEILMRGYVLRGLQNKYGAIIALIITTILFAILHFNFVQTLSAIICGLIIGLLYIKTNSLFCCILSHALYNSISYFTTIVIWN